VNHEYVHKRWSGHCLGVSLFVCKIITHSFVLQTCVTSISNTPVQEGSCSRARTTQPGRPKVAVINWTEPH